jgi:flavodoxin
MVNATDLFVLALGGLLTVAFLYRDRLPFIGAPTKTPTPAAKTANGAAEAAAALGGYQGDVRDFATRMKDQVSAPRSARRGRLSEGWKGPRRRGGKWKQTRACAPSWAAALLLRQGQVGLAGSPSLLLTGRAGESCLDEARGKSANLAPGRRLPSTARSGSASDRGGRQDGRARALADRHSSPASLSQKKRLAVFYGSQTGTAEEYATRIAKEAKARFGVSSLVCDIEEYDFDKLDAVPADCAVVFVMATYGEGEPTDNAVAFMELIEEDEPEFSEGSSLDGLRYVVFGLGNRTYVRRLPSSLPTAAFQAEL